MYSSFKKLSIVAITGLAISVGTAEKAEAFFGGGGAAESPWEARSNHSATRSHFTLEMTNMQLVLAEIIRQLGGQVSGNLKNQIAADANIAQTQDERERQREIERTRFEAIQEAETSSSTCRMITRSITGNIYGNSAAAESLLGAKSTAKKITAIVGGMRTAEYGEAATAGSRTQAAEALTQDLATKYCSPETASAGLCSPDEYVDPSLQNAHLDASSILNDNITTQEEADACEHYNMVSAGTPTGGNIAGAANRAVNSSTAYMDRTVRLNRASLSANIMESYCKRRSSVGEGANTGSSASVYKAIASKSSSISYEEIADGVSWFKSFEIMSQSFLGEGNLQELEKNGEVQMLKELYYVVGWLAYQNLEIYKVLDRQGVIQASQLSTMNEMLSELKEN